MVGQRIAFDNSYARLPARFFAKLKPTPVAAPTLIAANRELALELGLDPAVLDAPEAALVFGGNVLPEGSEPLAQAYAGHQFGGWVPQLGDGRAILLGEVVDQSGRRRDIQLKGAGRTPYSRGGDGRAWLGPVLREYLVSEAMHALGVPTTRALAAVATGEWVYREEALPGAILTRVAASHLRVGTFQFFAARNDLEALELLVDHAVRRHYPGGAGPLWLLDHVVTAQANLVAHWMSVGFIHGVMNTDNTSISGETIDYGPCAFLDVYHPDAVFSSIDQRGRYAYANQPQVMLWNLAQLASCLLPLVDADRERAIAEATAVLDRFAPRYEAAWLARFRAKLGFAEELPGDRERIEHLLKRMAVGRADFTRTFRGLLHGRFGEEFQRRDEHEAFERALSERWRMESTPPAKRAQMLAASNPAFHPRNHRIEELIQAAVAGDLAPFRRYLDVLRRPFDEQPDASELALAPKPHEVVEATFCGT